MTERATVLFMLLKKIWRFISIIVNITPFECYKNKKFNLLKA